MQIVAPGKRSNIRRLDYISDDVIKYEITHGMTKNRQYWSIMMKSGQHRSVGGP